MVHAIAVHPPSGTGSGSGRLASDAPEPAVRRSEIGERPAAGRCFLVPAMYVRVAVGPWACNVIDRPGGCLLRASGIMRIESARVMHRIVD